MHHSATTTLPTVYDVLIVGAGPCGLAMAARLREKTPSALFTDEEHQRYHWIKRHVGKATIKNRKTGKDRTGSSAFQSSPSMLVLDSSGEHWMSQWDRLFKELEITHLRSPMFFHPDPHDRDGLQAYVHEQGRECECVEIAGCVGREVSKHQNKKRRKQRHDHIPAKPMTTVDERDRKDYFAPPSDLFRMYCHFIAERYGLLDTDLIKQASVADIDYGIVPLIDTVKDIFSVSSDKGNFYARSVVLAVGAGNTPSIPSPFSASGCHCACHVFHSVDETLPVNISSSRRTNILVIGGGLTSAQVVDRALKQGASKVWHIMRGPLKIKPFDVDLSWMGKFKNHEKASFWSADTDEERSELVKLARGGGSITPRYLRILQQYEASGRVSIYNNTTIIDQSYNEERRLWKIRTEPAIEDLPEIDYIYFATGVQSDICKLNFMQTMLRKHKIECYSGVPALTDDLQWKDDVPLFISGKFASLRLGPGAGNLEGARTGAERIAWALKNVLRDEQSANDDGALSNGSVVDVQEELFRYQIGLGSRFASLAMEA